MGIISQYDDWILQKKEKGLYIIKYKEKPIRKIITENYDSRDIVTEKYEFSEPIDEVKSFNEVKTIFYLESEKSKNNIQYKKISILLSIIILIYISVQYSPIILILFIISGIIIHYLYNNYSTNEISYL